MFFYCEIISGEPTENIEIAEQGFFELNDLSLLSKHRVTEKQIIRLYKLVRNSQSTQCLLF